MAATVRLPEPVRLPPPDTSADVPLTSITTASVAAPSSDIDSTASLTERYALHCRSLQLSPHTGVLTFLRLHLNELRPEAHKPFRDAKPIYFTDADLYAFCDFLLRDRQPSGIFDHWEVMDASSCCIGYTGARILMRVLSLPGCRVHTVDLSHQDLGPRGADAVASAIRCNPRLSTVRMLGSFIHDAGAREFAKLLEDETGCPAAHALEELDLSVNMISYEVLRELEGVKPKGLKLVLRGNRVLDEVLNASSHALGVILVIIGAAFLGVQVAQKRSHGLGPDGLPLESTGYVTSTVVYLISLFLLYLFSTLYHALFALGDTVVALFTLFDHSCIYLLIAGSYTPFLTILFPDQPAYSRGLLGFLWVMAGFGIALNLCYQGPFKVTMQVSSYIGMGWAALLCFGDLAERLSPNPEAMYLVVGGGIAYTIGVPWFIKDGRTCGVPDHTIWHLFVLAGSTLHYAAVYLYIVPFPYDGVSPWS